MTISEAELEELKRLGSEDPDFVKEYLTACDKEGLVLFREPVREALPSHSYTLSEAADKFGVCKNTIFYHAVKQKRVPSFQDSDGIWRILASDIEKLKKFNVGEKAKKQEPVTSSGGDMYGSISQQNVLDFLNKWNKSGNFSIITLYDDIKPFVKEGFSQHQIGSALSALARKKILKRSGKGMYQFSKSSPADPVPAAPTLSIPVIEREPVEKDYCKKEERKALEDYVERLAKDDEDFVFTIESFAEQYPKLTYTKLAKACQNAKASGFIESGSTLGQYIKKAKNPNPKKFDAKTDIRGKIEMLFDEIQALKAQL